MTISAKIILHTLNSVTGAEAITWELEYPRFIHSEFMTHRVFSRNAASSRAIPVSKQIEQVRTNPAMPVHWGKNQAGMQAKEQLSEPELSLVITSWYQAARYAADFAEEMNRHGAHRQVINRVLEPFVNIKVVMTSTERENWYDLRFHEDAQPEIFDLAKIMRHTEDHSKPIILQEGDWHIPYLDIIQREECSSYSSDGELVNLDDALKLSASLCAQVSYRKADHSLEKARDIYKRLIESKPMHASPIEHQLLVSREGFEYKGWTHIDRYGDYWSGNIRGYVQYRQLIER